MLDKKITDFIDKKAIAGNENSLSHLTNVSITIKQLNDFIDERIELSDDRLDYLLGNLVGDFTVTLTFPLNKGTEIIRARKLDIELIKKSDTIGDIESPKPRKHPYLMEVKELSYIPKDAKKIPKIGRLNKEGESLFYGCISVNKDDGINVSFSEINALENEIVNTLLSTTIKDLNLHFIGIIDYYRRGVSPAFYKNSIFKEMYDYEKKMFDKNLMAAFELCDAFFLDVMSRKEHGNLYKVSSILASIFLKCDKVDGLIYESVQAKSCPNIVIKPESVDEKLKYKEINAFRIQHDYGYAIYRAAKLV